MPDSAFDLPAKKKGPFQKIRDAWIWLCASVAALPASCALRTALAIWLTFATVVTVVVAVDPNGHSATGEYRKAATNWWAGQPIYRKKNGYLYLPQEAMIYTPYNLLPARVGEPLWRLTCLALLAWAMWQAAGKLAPRHRAVLFLVATVFVFPSALSSARNGQVNLPLAAIYLLTAVGLAERRWIFTAFLLILSLALKPISIVPILLCGALYAPLRLPLLAGFVILFASAYLHPSLSYVQSQYQLFITTFIKAGAPTGNTWCDYAGIFRTFHLPLPDKLNTAVRALFAVITLGLCWWVTRSRDQVRSAFTVLLLAVVYLMLFNPRTETNSYVMAGAFAALWAAYEITVGRRFDIGAWLLAFAILLGSESYGWPIFPSTDHWAKALATIALGIWLVLKIANTPKGEPVLMLPPES